MKRWTIEGADVATGIDRVVTIEAATREDAEHKARTAGILISAVHESPDVDDTLNSVAIAAQSSRAPASVINYQRPSGPAIPAYAGLGIGSTILMVFAGLYYVIAGLLVIIAIASAAGVAHGDIPILAAGAGAMVAILYGLFLAMIGGFLHAASAACIALRDIAQNSFRR